MASARSRAANKSELMLPIPAALCHGNLADPAATFQAPTPARKPTNQRSHQTKHLCQRFSRQGDLGHAIGSKPKIKLHQRDTEPCQPSGALRPVHTTANAQNHVCNKVKSLSL